MVNVARGRWIEQREEERERNERKTKEKKEHEGSVSYAV